MWVSFIFHVYFIITVNILNFYKLDRDKYSIYDGAVMDYFGMHTKTISHL